jgi:HEAT repeat protein
MNRKQCVFGMLILLSTVHLSLAQQCPINSKSSTAELLSFIDQSNTTANADGRCFTQAFLYLSHNPANIDALLPFLDRKRPQTEEERQGWRSMQGIAGSYPAVAALVQIGRPAVPALINQLETSNIPLVRRNAAYALHMIFPLCSDELTSTLQAEEARSVAGSAQQTHLQEGVENINHFRRAKNCGQKTARTGSRTAK